MDSNELFINNLEVRDYEVVGQVGQGFRYLVDGLNPERTVVGMEGIGVGHAALDLATRYANERVVFDRLWREVRLPRLAPISQEMVLNLISTSVLGLPRSN